MIIIFTKNRVFIFFLIFSSIIAIIIFINQTGQRSFQEVFSKQLNEETTVRSISVGINEISGHRTETVSRAIIEDEQLIQDILADFVNVKLKEDKESRLNGKTYTIWMTVNNEIGENHSSTTTLFFDVDSDYLNEYKIISSSNHLKTIEAIVESEEIEWELVD